MKPWYPAAWTVAMFALLIGIYILSKPVEPHAGEHVVPVVGNGGRL